jgi:glycosyltransferase involved in cell wall biosynthesis
LTNLKPLISVLLPVYNGAATIRAAIESVIDQDYDNLEFIIVDNASTDATAEIIAEYCTDQRIRVIRNRQTVARLENFNIAFAAASGESCWYKFVGDDDRLLPGCLAEMVEAGTKSDHIGLVASHYYNGSCLVKGVLKDEDDVISGPVILKKMLVDPEARATIFSPTAVLIAPGAYLAMGGFRTDLLHADAELFYRILNAYDLAYVHRPLTVIGYHSGSGQALSTISGDTFAEAYLIRSENLSKYDRVKLNWFELEKIKNNLVVDSVGFMLARLAQGDYKSASRHLQRIPLKTIYHLLPASVYFALLAVRKLIRREPIRLFGSEQR